ncbi:MAG: ADP-forming succinate--CoA ligase subunit beta [Deltaproteobacteria bacterium]|nr:ADP-forming succinate--CoA ligase subunit beta [Deltaproteobacteria bacterium]
MNLHEYQSKKLMASYGLPVLAGFVCYTPGEAEAAADNLKTPVCVVKAQVHAGGRGKAGGVKVVKSPAEARSAAEKILGMKLVTPQTGEKGKLVRKIYVEAGCNIDKEFYLSMLVDRARKCISIVASTEGGMEIEEVAHTHPEKIITVAVDPRVGLQSFQATGLLLKLGLPVAHTAKFTSLLMGLYKMFVESDLSLLEVNPLVLTKEGTFVVLDAKCAVDDNALFRRPCLKEWMDYDEQDARDLRAGKFGLSYVGLDGTIGCMVNGAGLAMATMDIIKHFGGQPANFLDVGGGATKETVTEAFKILLSDENVKGILVNIFGGIMKCDVIANGIVEAAKELSVKVPLVVRLQGTNVELGRKILAESGLKIQPADTMDDAAKKIVAAVK